MPMAIQSAAINISKIILTAWINSAGVVYSALAGVYNKINMMIGIVSNSFTAAGSTMVGQNLGAKQYTRTKQGVAFGVICSCLMAEVIGVFCYLFAPQMIGFFSETQEAINFGTEHMRTICLFFCLLAFSHCIAGIMRGAGKATVPMFTMLGCWCLFRVTYISIAVKYINKLTTVSWAYPITWILSGIIFLIYFLFGDWIHNFDRESQRT